MVETHYSGRISLNFWGFIGVDGVGELREIAGRFNAIQYVDVLDTTFYPAVRRMLPVERYPVINLVHDNNPIHRARIVTDWFARHPDINVIPHPAKSPDLNPIENIWGIMVRRRRSGEVRTVPALRELVHQTWERLRTRPQLVANCVNSMPTRLRKVIAANGYWTKY